MSVVVRPALVTDEDAVFALLPQLLGEREHATPAARNVFRDLCAGAGGAALVAADAASGSVLGVITVSYVATVLHAGRYAQIEELVVDEAARGRDAGAALVLGAIEAASAAGCVEIGLYSREHTRPFYERYGFAYTGPELRRVLP